MLQFRPLDPSFPIDKQLAAVASPAVLVNIFTVGKTDVEPLLRAWEKDALWMKRQPGFISTQLHRAIGGSYVFMNYAVWESVDHFRQAFTHLPKRVMHVFREQRQFGNKGFYFRLHNSSTIS